MVLMDVPGDGSAPVVVLDHTIPLQTGDRAVAYAAMHARVQNLLREKAVAFVAVKGSAVSQGGTKKGHLEACELRGVVCAAAAAQSKVVTLTKSSLSRNFGTRKADEYVKDDAYWADALDGAVRKGSREAALFVLAAQ